MNKDVEKNNALDKSEEQMLGDLREQGVYFPQLSYSIAKALKPTGFNKGLGFVSAGVGVSTGDYVAFAIDNMAMYLMKNAQKEIQTAREAYRLENPNDVRIDRPIMNTFSRNLGDKLEKCYCLQAVDALFFPVRNPHAENGSLESQINEFLERPKNKLGLVNTNENDVNIKRMVSFFNGSSIGKFQLKVHNGIESLEDFHQKVQENKEKKNQDGSPAPTLSAYSGVTSISLRRFDGGLGAMGYYEMGVDGLTRNSRVRYDTVLRVALDASLASFLASDNKDDKAPFVDNSIIQKFKPKGVTVDGQKENEKFIFNQPTGSLGLVDKKDLKINDKAIVIQTSNDSKGQYNGMVYNANSEQSPSQKMYIDSYGFNFALVSQVPNYSRIKKGILNEKGDLRVEKIQDRMLDGVYQHRFESLVNTLGYNLNDSLSADVQKIKEHAKAISALPSMGSKNELSDKEYKKETFKDSILDLQGHSYLTKKFERPIAVETIKMGETQINQVPNIWSVAKNKILNEQLELGNIISGRFNDYALEREAKGRVESANDVLFVSQRHLCADGVSDKTTCGQNIYQTKQGEQRKRTWKGLNHTQQVTPVAMNELSKDKSNLIVLTEGFTTALAVKECLHLDRNGNSAILACADAFNLVPVGKRLIELANDPNSVYKKNDVIRIFADNDFVNRDYDKLAEQYKLDDKGKVNLVRNSQMGVATKIDDKTTIPPHIHTNPSGEDLAVWNTGLKEAKKLANMLKDAGFSNVKIHTPPHESMNLLKGAKDYEKGYKNIYTDFDDYLKAGLANKVLSTVYQYSNGNNNVKADDVLNLIDTDIDNKNILYEQAIKGLQVGLLEKDKELEPYLADTKTLVNELELYQSRVGNLAPAIIEQLRDKEDNTLWLDEYSDEIANNPTLKQALPNPVSKDELPTQEKLVIKEKPQADIHAKQENTTAQKGLSPV